MVKAGCPGVTISGVGWRWDFGQRRGSGKGFSLYQKSPLKASICLLLSEDPPSVPAGHKAGNGRSGHEPSFTCVPAGLTLGVSCFLRVSLVLQSFLGPRHKANACAAYQEQCLLCHLLLWGAGRSSCHREAGEVDAPFIDILRRKAGTLEM